MNLSKVLKQKRDAEDRLRQSSPQVQYIEGTGYIDLSKLALKDHKHSFLGLTDVPESYVADKVVKVNSAGDALIFADGGGAISQATETTLGGIKAKAKTTESSEIAIDIETGKLYGPAPDEASNGVAAGGTAGQIYSKIDGTDYNAQWIDAPSGGGGTPKDRIYVPYGTNLGYDDEFDDGVIDSNWVSIDVSSKENLWYEPSGIKGLSCYVPSGKGGFKLCGKLKPLGEISYPMYIETAYKLQGRSAGYPHAGLMFSNSNIVGSGLQIYCGYNGYHNKMFWGKQTNFTTRSSYGEYDMLPYGTTNYVHLRLVWVTANTFSIYFSMDGVAWILAYENLSYSMTPSYFGICENTEDNSTYPVLINYAYFRVRSGLPTNG